MLVIKDRSSSNLVFLDKKVSCSQFMGLTILVTSLVLGKDHCTNTGECGKCFNSGIASYEKRQRPKVSLDLGLSDGIGSTGRSSIATVECRDCWLGGEDYV